MTTNTHTEISGIFVKIINADDAELVLKHNSPERPAARYNRRGEDTLYLSADEYSARVAMQKYSKEINTPLVLVHYRLTLCSLIDLRLEAARDLKEMCTQDWRAEIDRGIEPTSWRVSDKLRAEKEIGLIDPSRKNPDVWHITLFRWNDEVGPEITVHGEPQSISLQD